MLALEVLVEGPGPSSCWLEAVAIEVISYPPMIYELHIHVVVLYIHI